MTKKIIDIFSKKLKKQNPIWLMRQAGRYLPEYRILRNKAKNFLDFCYNFEMASEATLQPLKRFNLDAAIIFSDILVIPNCLGLNVDFLENHGPYICPVQNSNQLRSSLKDLDTEKLENIYKAISIVKNELDKSKGLIGFAGGAWTIASYIVEGKLSKDLSTIKTILYKDKDFILELIDILVENISLHLIKQIEAGVDIIQIFDSWAGALKGDDYKKLIIEPNQKIVKKVKEIYPNVPIICFPRASGTNYFNFITEVDCDSIGVDQFTSMNIIKNNNNGKILQGNLDPLILLSENKSLIKYKVDQIFEEMEGESFIFNLGHGVVPNISPDMVNFLVDYVKKKESEK